MQPKILAPTRAHLVQASDALASGDPGLAYTALGRAFVDPSLASDTGSFVTALGLLSEIAASVAGPEFAQRLRRAAATPDDAAVLLAVGEACIEQHLLDAAACVLGRAVALVPGVAAPLVGLANVLASTGQYAPARAQLQAASPLLDTHFELRYLLAFHTLMCGDVSAAIRGVQALGDPQGPEQSEMLAHVSTMLARAHVVQPLTGLDDRDLRGWHFVANGSLLLHLAPFGFDDGMHGRYAMTQDSAVRCRQGLLRVHAVLDEWERLPERVLLLPDHDSHVLGLAAAAVYGVPAQPFREGLPGLIVAYDLNALDPSTHPAVADHHPQQILFAHATCWTDPPPCVPDLTTYLYELNVPPEQQLDAQGERLGSRAAAPDDPNTELAVQAILDAIVDDDPAELPIDDLQRLVAFAEAVGTLSSTARLQGPRLPMWPGGPVPSHRLGDPPDRE